MRAIIDTDHTTRRTEHVSGQGGLSFDRQSDIVLGPAMSRRLSPAAYSFAQRLLDMSVSLVILLVSWPVMLAIGLLIKLDSPGSALFKHRRVGRNRRAESSPSWMGRDRRISNLGGRPFVLYKFRTMYANARELFPHIYAYSYSSEELQRLPIKSLVGSKSHAVDPRLTRVGRWLRKTSLDELPNFINVLKGDMHLVGPRPDMPKNLRYYASFHLKKFSVKPGVTGLAQIAGRGNLSFDKTNQYDVEYVENRSLLLDLKILAKTIAVTINARGAY
jgi:lipopolysaccharide/colanic/teichoic acid biosynthesis glycosyltransferase